MVDENVESDESTDGEIGPIGKSVIRGAGIFGLIRVSTGGLSAVVRVIGVASLLGPREFGLFGALLVLSVLDVLSQTGFESALVQRPGKIDSHLDTAFVSHIIRGLTLASIIYFGAVNCSPFSKPCWTFAAATCSCDRSDSYGVSKYRGGLFEPRSEVRTSRSL